MMSGAMHLYFQLKNCSDERLSAMVLQVIVNSVNASSLRAHLKNNCKAQLQKLKNNGCMNKKKEEMSLRSTETFPF